jgi:hypothetical protein
MTPVALAHRVLCSAVPVGQSFRNPGAAHGGLRTCSETWARARRPAQSFRNPGPRTAACADVPKPGPAHGGLRSPSSACAPAQPRDASPAPQFNAGAVPACRGASIPVTSNRVRMSRPLRAHAQSGRGHPCHRHRSTAVPHNSISARHAPERALWRLALCLVARPWPQFGLPARWEGHGSASRVIVIVIVTRSRERTMKQPEVLRSMDPRPCCMVSTY